MQAFGSVLGSSAPSPAVAIPVAAPAIVKPVEARQPAEFIPASNSVYGASSVPSSQIVFEAAGVSPLSPASNGRSDVAKAAAPTIEPLRAEAAKPDTLKADGSRPDPTKAAKVQPPKAAKPPALSNRPGVVAPSNHRRRSMVLAASAVVIVLAICLPMGARWLGLDTPPPSGHDGQRSEPAPVAENRSVADPPAPPRSSLPDPVAANPEPAPAPPRAAAAARLPAAAKPPKVVRAPAAVVVASSVPTEAPAAVTAPPAPVRVAAELPRPSAPEPPAGRFFEPGDVDQSPQVATRVEPRLPADLPRRSLNDVVVVRLLVSQTGHPFRVSLLRRSRVGQSLDDAVVAAVTKWTFSPARKRGEAVSCWYNVGVPLGQAN